MLTSIYTIALLIKTTKLYVPKIKSGAFLQVPLFFYFIPQFCGMSKTTYTVEEATKKLEHYCAYQERCHHEVVQKLRQMKMIPQAIDAIVGHLIQHNYLNETRFAQSFARGKFRIKQWGKERITRELKLRQISPFNIRLALKEIDEEDYQSTLSNLAEKFWNTHADRALPLRKKKVLDALRYRGWESERIFTAIRQLEIETGC